MKKKSRGFINANDVYIAYSFCITDNYNKSIYFCIEGANGITKNSMISDFNKLIKEKITDINYYTKVINKYGFEYIMKSYNNDNVHIMYVLNEEYTNAFIDSDFNSRYADLD